MLTPIADVARYISYDTHECLDDHDEVRQRCAPPWMSFLPENPLVVADTADVHCWCGRQAGSLSRFNLYSAQVCVELAGLARQEMQAQNFARARNVGIVTPYAAQRRLLTRLVDALDPGAWVQVGTVHTFQGGEAELVIFDVVLDDPYWTARLCNPKQISE